MYEFRIVKITKTKNTNIFKMIAFDKILILSQSRFSFLGTK